MINPSLKLALSFQLRLKNTPRQEVHLSIDQTQALWEFFTLYRASPEKAEHSVQHLPQELQQYLRETGVLVSQETVPGQAIYDPIFSLNQELPSHIGLKAPLLGPVFWNPLHIWQEDEHLPRQLMHELLPFQQMCLKPPVLWVKEPVYGQLLPYRMTQGTQQQLKLLYQQDPQTLSIELKHRLLYAGILQPFSRAQLPLWQNSYVQDLQKTLKQNHYGVLKGFLTPYQIMALRQYYRCLKKEGYLIPEVTPKVNRLYCNQDPITDFMHMQLFPFVQSLVEQEISPSYSFISYYEGGGMGRHRDQERCLWNISVMVDPQPDISPLNHWPLHIAFPDHTLDFSLFSGDAVVYQGTEYTHWREPLDDTQKATVTLFHFHSPPKL